ncbi:MAG: Lrp/AsnC ligand binding domain-containing protein [Candidatus Hadarchaeales archaeon]
MKAYCLISTDPGQTNAVFQKLKQVEGIKSAEAVAGPFDIITRIEVDSLEKLTKIVFGEIRSLPGVTNTATLIVFEL